MSPHDYDFSAIDLAFCEAALPEWDRLHVRDHWEAVVAEELGSPEPLVAPFVWSELGSGERVRLRRYQRRVGNSVLRLVSAAAEVPAGELDGEAA
ncbi:hypothetical protein GCM10027271_14620 [Saccharopolyspora gloriosae]|uniref:Uncharacterized protein n=1 Tax=Saccharopolyspora gloriosae TaxID=455344 RepID=A0A840NA59_9PSEU|nr:hypothetical protein [Saccharopolyspora gloriosae]MBB5067015.1 hypothetical protein [Saccharopolyspora gloriosae]